MLESMLNFSTPLWDFFGATLGNEQLWGFLAASLFIAAGFIGTFVPVLPGTILIFCGFLIYGLIADFSHFSLFFFVGETLLVACSYLIDFLASSFGVKMYGGSRAAIYGAMFGSLLIFVIGPFGILIGPLLGAIAGEMLMGEKLKQSMRAGFGSFIGFVGGTLANLFIGIIMVGWFLWRI